MRQLPTRRLTVALLAGAAASVLTVAGCAAPFDERADLVDPQTGGPFVPFGAEPAYSDIRFANGSFGANPNNNTVPAPTVQPGPAQNNQRADAGSSDGWLLVAAAADAEVNNQRNNQRNTQRNNQAAAQPAAGSTPSNANAGPTRPSGNSIAARLYNDILNTNIPTADRPQGTHTVNIQQMSFATDGSDFDPSVSRDGTSLVYASTQHRPEADIYMQRIGSRVITRLTDDPAGDVMPTISGDGRRIAYSSNRAGNWDIWIMPSSGGRSLQVTQDPAPELHPSFSPDGQHVVYCRLGMTSGRWEIWVSDTFGDAGAQFIGYGLFPEWSPVAGTGSNGSDRIVFQRSRERGSRTFSIWTIDYDRARGSAGRETQIASDPSFALINPTWSPDGARIAYASVPNPEEWTGTGAGALPPSASIQMIGVDGRGTVSLTSGNAIDMMPAWGATGRVFFVSDRSGVENLWAVDIAPAILAATGRDPWNEMAAEPGATGFAPSPFGPGMPGFVSAPTEP